MTLQRSCVGVPDDQGMLTFPSLREEDLHRFVVLGRGNQHTKFPGNQRFYDAIDLHMPMYDVATSKFLKSQVIHTIWQSLSSSGMIFLRKDKKTGIYHQIHDMACRQKISHAIRYKRNSEETQLATSDTGDDKANSSALHVVSSERVSDDAESHSPVESDKDITPTPTIDLFSDEDLDSVLPIHFRVDLMRDTMPSNGAALSVSHDWSISHDDETSLPKVSILDTTLSVFQDWSIPLIDETPHASDLNDFMMDTYQVDVK